MSLLQKASIITTPTAYAEDYLYSIKPAYALGTELVTNGEFYSDSDWSKGTGWSIANGKASKVAGSAAELTQASVFPSGFLSKKFKITFTLVVTAGSVRLRAGTNSQSYLNASGTYSYTLTPAGNDQLKFDADSSFVGSVDGVSCKEVTDADFDFDRNSTGTRVNEDYLIEDVPYNFAQNSEDIDGTGWSNFFSTLELNSALAPDGTQTADKIISTSGGRLDCVVSNGMANTQYTTSFYAKANNTTAALCQIYEDSSGTFLATLDYTNLINTETWTRITVTYTTTVGGNIRSQIIKNMPNGESVFFWGTQVVKGDQPKDYLKTTDRLDIPRIDYTNGEPSILLEPSRTNLITYSNDFTNAAWNKTNATITANQAISPEGIQNADKYSGTTIGQNFFHTISVSDNFSYSVYVKYINAPFIRLRVNSISTWFNIETIEVATNGFADASIEDVGNGWRKLTVINTTSGSFTTAYIHPHATDNTTDEQDGGEFFLYGAQLEAVSYATSLIHTSGSTVTRSADTANNAGNSDLINSTEGVLYAEYKPSFAEGSRQITISDGTYDDRIVFECRESGTKLRANVAAGGVSQVVITIPIPSVDNFYKIAIKYKANDVSFYIDGRLQGTDTSATMPTGLNVLAFSGRNDNSLIMTGNTKCVAVFKEALTDLELEKLTGYNNHELYMNYYNRLSYLGLVEEYNVESDINNYIL